MTKEEIIAGYRMSYEEALELYRTTEKEKLYMLADELRKHYLGNRIETCMIMNARSGRCSEDCKWCSQSKHHHTDVQVYGLVDEQDALKEAKYAENSGVNCFSLVTSGRAVTGKDFEKILFIYQQMKQQAGVHLCASLGLLDEQQMQDLASIGLKRYHCNIESAPSYFRQLCTTHTMEEKAETLRAARQAGLGLCSGGIIGMGETMEQRIEMAVFLSELEVDSIPVNILQPIPGTPLENVAPLTDEEILDSFAMFRILNPKAQIRFAAGRLQIKHIEEKALKCGVSAALVGDMLTTVGSNMKDDFENFRKMGYEVSEE